MNKDLKISVIIPVYNEEKSIKQVVIDLDKKLTESKLEYEIIVVNDGSSDNSKNILNQINNLTLINHPYNKGYGASIKTGVVHSKYNWILLYDGDGQHQPHWLDEFFSSAGEFDMIIGARQGYQGPWIRQPGKKLLNSIASYLVDFKIPDLNSGLRLIKKDLFFRFSHLYPNNFSLTTTITLAFIKEALNVKYIPIKIEKRLGTSTVKPRDALQTFILITRIITLFSPMRFFLPISLFLLILTSVSLIYDFTERNISDASVILFLGSVLTFFFGTILDQISALRRHNK